MKKSLKILVYFISVCILVFGAYSIKDVDSYSYYAGLFCGLISVMLAQWAFGD